MPVEKKPTSATFPPKGGTAYKVRLGDTWGTIASANGLSVQDLISFNFGFPANKRIDPAEINWCMRSWIGCRQATFDKKNWIFSADANPGMIFIPSKLSVIPTKPANGHAVAVSQIGLGTAPIGVLAQESDITTAPLRINGAYDLKLSRLSSGDYELLCFMKIQFFFEDGKAATWSNAEKNKFMKDWEIAVKTSWGGGVIKTLPVSKRKVFLQFSFSIQEGGWMFDHWEITVTKIAAGSFRTSYVQANKREVTLDSEDLNHVTKTNRHTCKQRGVVHEFGHMLGIKDEYIASSAHVGDAQSIMHSCEVISMRHNDGFVRWLDIQIARLGLD